MDHSSKRSLLRWCLAFFIPFVLVFALLVGREKNLAYEDIHRSPQAGQILNGPSDELEAWKMGASFTALIATPAGLLGLCGYGGFLLIRKWRRKQTESAERHDAQP